MVKPEILDTLPPGDPAAAANLRDLRLLNRLMGNWRWAAGILRRRLRPGDHVLEAGAGLGDFGRELRRNVPQLRTCRYTGLDLRERPADWPAAWEWRQGDLLAQDFTPAPRVLLVNFLLHQFTDAQLASLGRSFAGIPVWIFCEPYRSRLPMVALALLQPLGLHPITGHDGRVSIQAGFRGRELADRLAAVGARTTRIAVAPRGSYRLVSWDPGVVSG
ncbi:MAG: class I SAM-dependent methyltransferase [Candidatus Krumholzibacteriia bacterium]